MNRTSARPRKIATPAVAAAAALAAVAAVAAFIFWLSADGPAGKADPSNPALVARGRIVYDQYCASCHGRNLQGQPDWRSRLATGRMPAPPHDQSGHTWHHPDAILFDITKAGVQSHAPPGYESDMPAFGGTLSDEDIWAALSYIKSRWPKEIQERQSLMNRRAGT